MQEKDYCTHQPDRLVSLFSSDPGSQLAVHMRVFVAVLPKHDTLGTLRSCAVASGFSDFVQHRIPVWLVLLARVKLPKISFLVAPIAASAVVFLSNLFGIA